MKIDHKIFESSQPKKEPNLSAQKEDLQQSRKENFAKNDVLYKQTEILNKAFREIGHSRQLAEQKQAKILKSLATGEDLKNVLIEAVSCIGLLVSDNGVMLENAQRYLRENY